VLPSGVFWVTIQPRILAKLLILLVGAAGFEPTTPSPPDWCANRAAPRPDRNGEDYRTVRACCFDYRIRPHVATLSQSVRRRVGQNGDELTRYSRVRPWTLSAYWRSRADQRSRSRSSRRHITRYKTQQQIPVSSWWPFAKRATHIAHLCRRLWCKHTGRNVPALTINSGCPFARRGINFDRCDHVFCGPPIIALGCPVRLP
jgi:hypothetical protein